MGGTPKFHNIRGPMQLAPRGILANSSLPKRSPILLSLDDRMDKTHISGDSVYAICLDEYTKVKEILAVRLVARMNIRHQFVG